MPNQPTVQPETPVVEHRQWRITGQIQGVGFRPFVYRIATEVRITGSVRNDPSGVTICANGEPHQLDDFINRIQTEAPPLSHIDSIRCTELKSTHESNDSTFSIIQSDHEPARRGRITIDSAVCDECLTELFDSENHRHRHALINCTNCGPRYTIVRDLPYDRPLTTMAAFPMCERCEREYRDPTDRRYHAQPTCCPECGPQVSLIDPKGNPITGGPFATAADWLKDGRIIAMKGLGGYHLVVDATNEKAVARLRTRKKRDHKPFAIMVRSIEQAEQLVTHSNDAAKLLQSPISPIILAPRTNETAHSTVQTPAPSIAPSSNRLGIMLPNTPMQHLLFAEDALADRPLVMTSANLSDDPLISKDDQAFHDLDTIADAFLTHDRPIERAVDDSILIDAPQGLTPIRLARGYVPTPIKLPITAPQPGLCVGGELKNTVGIVRDNEVILSQHIGDLTYTLAYERFIKTIDDLKRLFDIEPEWIACDPHPRYMSRRYARRIAQKLLHGQWHRFSTCASEAKRSDLRKPIQSDETVSQRNSIPLIEIQHHHAHLASLAAEHGRTDPIIGLVCDGVGYGDDGTAWGGEIMVADLISYTRLGRLRPMRLPGGDAAAKEIGRCALSWLVDLLGPDEAENHPIAQHLIPDTTNRQTILTMLRQNLSCPISSGMGRLFDAAAALLGICDYNHYEAMSGMMIESAATQSDEQPDGTGHLPMRESFITEESSITGKNPISSGTGFQPVQAQRSEAIRQSTSPTFELDTRPLLSELLDRIRNNEPTNATAWFFHDAIADGLANAAIHIAQTTGIKTVGLSGGVFCNQLLSQRVAQRLEASQLNVLTHQQVPANDGGLALGQAAIAAARLNHTNQQRSHHNTKEHTNVSRHTSEN